MKNKLYLILTFIILIIMMINIPVFAHKVNVFAYMEGDKIYSEYLTTRGINYWRV